MKSILLKIYSSSWIQSPFTLFFSILALQLVFLLSLFEFSFPLSQWDLTLLTKNVTDQTYALHLSQEVPVITWGPFPLMIKTTLSAAPHLFMILVTHFLSPALSLKISFLTFFFIAYITWFLALRKYYQKGLPLLFLFLSIYCIYLATYTFVIIEAGWVAILSGIIFNLLQKEKAKFILAGGLFSVFLLHLKFSTLPLLIVIYLVEQKSIRSYWKALLTGVALASPLFILNLLTPSALVYDLSTRFTPSFESFVVMSSAFIRLFYSPDFTSTFLTPSIMSFNFQSFDIVYQSGTFSYNIEVILGLLVWISLFLFSFFYHRRSFYLVLFSVFFFIIALFVTKNIFNFDFFLYLIPCFLCLLLALFEIIILLVVHPRTKKTFSLFLILFFIFIGAHLYKAQSYLKGHILNSTHSVERFISAIETRCAQTKNLFAPNELRGFIEFFSRNKLTPHYINTEENLSKGESPYCLISQSADKNESLYSYGIPFQQKLWKISVN